jgi:ABC-type transporter Mla subunit MlaD
METGGKDLGGRTAEIATGGMSPMSGLRQVLALLPDERSELAATGQDAIRVLDELIGQRDTLSELADHLDRTSRQCQRLVYTPNESNRHLAGAFAAVERLRQTVADMAVETEQGLLQVTASFGVATAMGNGADIIPAADDLIRVADRCLYEAKEQGRNRTVSDTPETPGEVPAAGDTP